MESEFVKEDRFNRTFGLPTSFAVSDNPLLHEGLAFRNGGGIIDFFVGKAQQVAEDATQIFNDIADTIEDTFDGIVVTANRTIQNIRDSFTSPTIDDRAVSTSLRATDAINRRAENQRAAQHIQSIFDAREAQDPGFFDRAKQERIAEQARVDRIASEATNSVASFPLHTASVAIAPLGIAVSTFDNIQSGNSQNILLDLATLGRGSRAKALLNRASDVKAGSRVGSNLPLGPQNLNPNQIRFTQPTISPNFSDGKNTISSTVAQLQNGTRKASDIGSPIRVVQVDGKLFTLDNRRLATFSQAGLKDIPVNVVSLKNKNVLAGFDRKNNPIRGEGRLIVVAPKNASPRGSINNQTSAQNLLLQKGLIRDK